MTVPIISHLLTRRYVTELIRSPRAKAALNGRRPGTLPAPRPAVRPAA